MNTLSSSSFLKHTLSLLIALLLVPLASLQAGEKAQSIVPPEVFIHHTPERSCIGPGMFRLENADILMAAPWGRPPTNFEQLAAKFPVPMLYRFQQDDRVCFVGDRITCNGPYTLYI